MPEPLTPMLMLGRAVASGAPVEVVEKLMGMHERWEANQARKRSMWRLPGQGQYAGDRQGTGGEQ